MLIAAWPTASNGTLMFRRIIFFYSQLSNNANDQAVIALFSYLYWELNTYCMLSALKGINGHHDGMFNITILKSVQNNNSVRESHKPMQTIGTNMEI